MRTRVREQVRPDESAAPAQAPVRASTGLRDAATSRDSAPLPGNAPWRRAAPLTAEDTALPGRMLMLLSRLHRSEMQLKADSEAAGTQGA
ncbi:hypothetical protein FF100_26715 [Methylobacterium terricola]|uniref:Uncharacterized protein n=1 Tax=Methylobacterium terricola TaxID=2583531 RepID=A0A5C4L9X0_9HYPH|nr:hypothetical protein [Methylobacterium terricola]TNC09428.1 hypothetical protein FF100_26715 [Methylobacterium terricola]